MLATVAIDKRVLLLSAPSCKPCPVPHEVVLWHFKWKASLFHNADVQRWGVLLLPKL